MLHQYVLENLNQETSSPRLQDKQYSVVYNVEDMCSFNTVLATLVNSAMEKNFSYFDKVPTELQLLNILKDEDVAHINCVFCKCIFYKLFFVFIQCICPRQEGKYGWLDDTEYKVLNVAEIVF